MRILPVILFFLFPAILSGEVSFLNDYQRGKPAPVGSIQPGFYLLPSGGWIDIQISASGGNILFYNHDMDRLPLEADFLGISNVVAVVTRLNLLLGASPLPESQGVIFNYSLPLARLAILEAGDSPGKVYWREIVELGPATSRLLVESGISLINFPSGDYLISLKALAAVKPDQARAILKSMVYRSLLLRGTEPKVNPRRKASRRRT